LLTTVAAEHEKKGRAVYPTSLDALLIAQLELRDFSTEPFTRDTLIYRLQDGRLLIHSRGYDGDDDGGKPMGPLL
jgi:hypothetical protein